MQEVDIIGGFPYADAHCKGCGKPLDINNAWMTDGCPCNTNLGVNSMNETRWRLLMHLQQKQSLENEQLKELVSAIDRALRVPAAEYVPAIRDVFTLIDNACAALPSHKKEA